MDKNGKSFNQARPANFILCMNAFSHRRPVDRGKCNAPQMAKLSMNFAALGIRGVRSQPSWLCRSMPVVAAYCASHSRHARRGLLVDDAGR